jgi:predicted ribonuclease YlaK
VQVFILDKPVGYLPGDEAERLADWLDARAAEGLQVWCPVRVTIEMGLAEVCVDLY